MTGPEQPGSPDDKGRTLQEALPKELTLRFFIPFTQYEHWNLAVSLYGERCTEEGRLPQMSEFIETLLLNFLYTWGTGVEFHDFSQKYSFRGKVMRNANHECEIPVCTSRRLLNAHHIKPKSKGGSNKEGNGCANCWPHHIKCVHEGYIRIEREDNGDLIVTLGTGGNEPPFAVFKNGFRLN